MMGVSELITLQIPLKVVVKHFSDTHTSQLPDWHQQEQQMVQVDEECNEKERLRSAAEGLMLGLQEKLQGAAQACVLSKTRCDELASELAEFEKWLSGEGRDADLLVSRQNRMPVHSSA
jgi:hypothetical protein